VPCRSFTHILTGQSQWNRGPFHLEMRERGLEIGWEHSLVVELVCDASDSVETAVMRDIRLGNSRQRR
jgi:hypothetical protein